MTPPSNRRGIVLMLLAMACYVFSDTLVKLTLQTFPAGQVLAVRGFAAAAVLGMVAWRHSSRAAAFTQDLRRPVLAIRCALEITTAATSVLALSHASLSIVSALMMTAPLLIVAGSLVFRWEPVRLQGLLTVAVGFCGALLVLRPSMDATAIGVTLSGLCALSLAARDLVTRRLPTSLSSATVAAVTTLAVCAAGPALGWALHESWTSLARRETLLLIGAAVCTASGNYALIAACRGTDLSVVTPFRYSLIVWACLAGYLVWGDVPGRPTLVGMVVIAAAGIAASRTRGPR